MLGNERGFQIIRPYHSFLCQLEEGGLLGIHGRRLERETREENRYIRTDLRRLPS